jgi:hypothetical protein
LNKHLKKCNKLKDIEIEKEIYFKKDLNKNNEFENKNFNNDENKNKNDDKNENNKNDEKDKNEIIHFNKKEIEEEKKTLNDMIENMKDGEFEKIKKKIEKIYFELIKKYNIESDIVLPNNYNDFIIKEKFYFYFYFL